MTQQRQLQLPLAAALLSALSGSLWAESAAYQELDPVVVTATRTAQPLSQAASSISVVKAKDIEETVPQTFTDTLLDIPNVDVESSSSVMFSRIRIRGSEPNQITYLVDGLRQDDTTAAGNQFIGIFIDPELLKQVEVKRGGGSSLYGNGGIGGTLSVTTNPSVALGAVLSTFHCAIDSSDEQSHAPLPPMPPMSRSPFNGSCRMPHIGADFAAELFGINFY